MLKPKTKKRKKPAKPYADFPLTAHANGQWCKKIKGKVYFFGIWAESDSALAKYLDERDDLQAGRQPKRLSSKTELTLSELWNLYLHAQKERLDTGEISQRTWLDRKKEATRMIEVLGRGLSVDSLSPTDFARLRNALAKKFSPVVVKITISRIKSMFTWAFESELIEKPMRYGPGFKPPTAKVIRQQRQQAGKLMFESNELKTILEHARQPLSAMTLLALNCAFGNSDVAELPVSAIDLKRGWVDFPRQKTGIERRCPLWPETVAALKEAYSLRPMPNRQEDASLFFLTQPGEPWVRVRETEDGKLTPIDTLGPEFSKLLKKLGLKRDRLNFYGLRHTFRTVADAVKDRGAVDFIMGHAPGGSDMRAVYVEEISDERLKDVTDHVRGWLFAGAAQV